MGGQPAIIMEFVNGIDLKQLIERLQQPLPPTVTYRIARDTASALEAAYFRAPYGSPKPLHLVHRDIKPSNIMVSVEGEVKVLDFGTARYQNEIRLAQTGGVRFGSLKYMSPERRRGDRGDHTSDTYALGLVMLEMSLGKLLPIIPLEPKDHDDFIGAKIQSLKNLGLPNEAWRTYFKETLSRMCSFHSRDRLTAEQLVEPLRSLHEQASGSSLERFGRDTITRLHDDIYGQRTQGVLTGKRITALLTSSGELSPEEQEMEPTMADEPVFRPPPTPTNGPSIQLLSYGLIAGFIAFVGVATVGCVFVIAGLIIVSSPSESHVSTEAHPPTEHDTQQANLITENSLEDSFTLSMHANDPTIQWVKLKTAGVTVMKADPHVTQSIEGGDYSLDLKLIGRPAYSHPFAISRDMTVSCIATTGGAQCEGPGMVTLVFPPSQ